MKKQIAVLALSVAGLGTGFGAFLDSFSATSTIGFESEYVFRGGAQYDDGTSIAPGLKVMHPFYEGQAYVGYWGSYPTSNRGTNRFSESDVYAGYNKQVVEWAKLDTGFTYYGYYNTPSYQDNWKEFYFGATFTGLIPNPDFELNPSVYAYYNFSGEAITVEGSISRNFSLEQFVPNLSLSLASAVGMASFDDALGDQEPTNLKDVKDSYTYWKESIDLVYTLNKVASFSVGMRYSGNNNNTKLSPTGNKGYNLYTFKEEDSLLWWGTSATFGF